MQTFTTPAPVTAVLAIPAGRIQVTAAELDTATDRDPPFLFPCGAVHDQVVDRA
jgi:hypothetical protein